MAGKTHCPECCDCIIATDDFNREDSDDLGDNWDEHSGDTDISDEAMLFVTSPAIVVFQVPHPGGASAPRRVKVRFKMPSGGGILQIFPSWTDDDDRVEAQVKTDVTCDEISLIKYESGTQTFLNPGDVGNGPPGGPQIVGDGVPDEEWHTLEVCLDPGSGYYNAGGVLRVRLRLASGKVYGHQYTGELAGSLLVAMQGSPGVMIDDFSFEWMKDESDEEHDRCPQCNTPCLVEDDDFNRADSTDLGCKWYEVSGLWHIVATKLMLVSAAPGIVLCRVFHPQVKTHHHVTCDLFVDASVKPRVIVNSNHDGTSYHWAELEYTGTELILRIGKDGNTLRSTLTTQPFDPFVPITVCFNGVSLIATTEFMTLRANSSEVENGVFVGVGGQNANERFDDFVFHKHRDTDNLRCQECPVEGQCASACCDTDIPPYFLYADIGAGGWFGAAFCDDFFGEYVLINENVGSPLPPIAGCQWYFLYFPDGSGPGDGGQAFTVRATLMPSSVDPADIPAGHCVWQVLVIYSQAGVFLNQAEYRSAPFEEGQCSRFPFRLFKVSEVSGNCDGTMPSFIDLYE